MDGVMILFIWLAMLDLLRSIDFGGKWMDRRLKDERIPIHRYSELDQSAANECFLM